MENTDKNSINNITNDVPVAGTDLFADSEDFLNELTDTELAQVAAGGRYVFENQSNLSIILCQDLGPI